MKAVAEGPLGRLARRPWFPWLVLALVGAVGAGAYALADRHREECPGHWHGAFQVYMDGNPVHYGRPVFYRAPEGIKDYDLHADDQVMHYHPQMRERCIPVSHFLAHLGIQLTDASITFNENFGGNAGTYRDNATRHLEVHYQDWNGTWREVEWSDIRHHQMAPGDKLLVTYGELAPDEVEREKASVRDLPDHYLPPERRRGPAQDAGDEHAPPEPGA